MSVADDIYGEQTEQLAVLFCDLSHSDPASAVTIDTEAARWRVNYFRTAREIAAEHGGHEAATGAGGWAATFDSTIEALVCARELSAVVGWQSGGPSLSAGLSAGDVTRDPFGIGGRPVLEAIALCRQAHPRQVLVANPLQVVVAPSSTDAFAPVPPAADAACELDAAGLAGLAAIVIGPPDRALDQPWSRGATPLGAMPVGVAVAAGFPGAPVAVAPALRLVRADDEPRSTVEPSAGVRLRVLGWVQLETAGSVAAGPADQRSVLRGSQARAVLSLLALRHRPVHKDELGELLWPAVLPDHWEGALRGLVTKIRRFLESGGVPGRVSLVGDDGYYELRLPPDVVVDRHEATTLLAGAETALLEQRVDEAAALARDAVRILERPLLAGPDYPWFDQVRAELTHDRLAALELWARADLKTGCVEGAKRAATEAVALDPYRESSYRLLMQAHAAAGSRGEALRTYEQCRRMLADELGVGPAPQTQALYIYLLG